MGINWRRSDYGSILLWLLGGRYGPLNKGLSFLDAVFVICLVFLVIKYCSKFWHIKATLSSIWE